MTLAEALTAINRSRPGILSAAEAISEISNLDRIVFSHVYKPRLFRAPVCFAGYDENTPGDTKLLLPDEYSALYIHKLEAAADYNSGEIERYNCGASLFNSLFDEFVKHFAVAHRQTKKLHWRF